MKLTDWIDFEKLSFDVICEKITQGEHFSLSRFGDGEFNAILNVKGENCDGHPYYEEMGWELSDILKSKPAYYIGLHQNRKLVEPTINWLLKNGYPHELTQKFVSNAVFHCALRDNLMNQFWTALGIANSPQRINLIGPTYLKKQNIIPVANFIEIPGKNTYQSIGRVLSDVRKYNHHNYITLICASMCAPIIVDDLYRIYGKQGTFIDFGSCLDPYVGRHSRSFHKQTNISK